MQTLRILASRHRLATLIAVGSLLLAAAAPALAHHQSAGNAPGEHAVFSAGSLDSATDETDDGEAGETGTDENGTANQDETDSNDQTGDATDGDSAETEDASDDDSVETEDANDGDSASDD